MKLGVVGGRNFTDVVLLKEVLGEYNISAIVSGGAQGADTLAENYAKENNVELKVFKPDWEKYGKPAGYMRNVEIVAASDIIVAFWDGKSKGTKLTIDICKKKNKPLRVVNY